MAMDLFAVDDDWGSAIQTTPYPTLGLKQQVSRTVHRKRLRTAQKVQEMSEKAVKRGKNVSCYWLRHNMLPLLSTCSQQERSVVALLENSLLSL